MFSLSHVDDGYTTLDRTSELLKHVSLDFLASRVWVLLHHARFHTFVHHDASGLATWTAISSGSKFWVVTVLHGENLIKTRSELYDSYTDQYRVRERDGEWGYGYVDASDRICIFGQAGDMMSVSYFLSFHYSDIIFQISATQWVA